MGVRQSAIYFPPLVPHLLAMTPVMLSDGAALKAKAHLAGWFGFANIKWKTHRSLVCVRIQKYFQKVGFQGNSEVKEKSISTGEVLNVSVLP